MKFLLLLVGLGVSVAVAAQGVEGASTRGIEGVRRGLAPQIEVRETADVQAVTAAIDAAPRAERITVYAVRLLSDNSQNAGANARAAAARFNETFGGAYAGAAGASDGGRGGFYGGGGARVDYQTPYFRVTVGRFVDRTDAVALCGKVLGVFPKSFVVEEHISVE